MNEQATEWLTVFEVSTRLGRSEKSVRRLIKNGAIQAVKVPGSGGQEWRIEPESLEQYRSSIAPGRSAGARDNAAGEALEDPELKEKIRVKPGTPTPDVAAGGTPEDNSRLSRVEGYIARDLEMIVGRAVSEAISSALAPLLEEIKQLAAVQAGQVAENAALRLEVELMTATQMAVQLAAVSPEGTHEPPDTTKEEMLNNSLKQMQEMSDEVNSLQAENERLKFELEKTRRSWWRRFFFDP
jgi:excisionase family DNA binding protein